METSFRYLPVCILILSSFLATTSHASDTDDDFISLKSRLVEDGFDADEVKAVLKKAKLELKGISLYFVHHEGKLDYGQFTTGKAIQNARKYMVNHRKELSKAHDTFKVEPEVVTAIMLVETRLGSIVGTRSVLNSFAGMAALEDPRIREKLWRRLEGPEQSASDHRRPDSSRGSRSSSRCPTEHFRRLALQDEP